MQTLCFGGSFNPIHHGHLICARVAAELGGFKRVLLIPNAQSPLKAPLEAASGEHRLHMCQLAVEGDPMIKVSDIELNRLPPSYTIDTVRELKRIRKWKEVWWLIGADAVPQLRNWHEPDALMNETRFVVMKRSGQVIEHMEMPNVTLVDTPLIDISATDIRRRVREQRSIEYLTPTRVCDYIRAEGLYL